ncbi:MAG TPA: trypsin-like peptidase domain-containing protein [Steroidobacteraceae bacterium]|nr:trypsin-like peptidase domain-containing protein [Steroidobacteraceae bacterium]
MNLTRIGHSLVFLAGTVVGGLALAFVMVWLHPEWLLRAPAASAIPAASIPAPELGARNPTVEAIPAPLTPKLPGNPAEGVPEAHSFAAAVRRAAPAVVNIYTTRLITERVQPSSLEQLFGQISPRYRQRLQRALGSGVLVDAAGHIVTNNHVIDQADSIMVQLADGRTVPARIVGRDADTDLAVLVIKLGHLPVMPMGRSDELQVGDEVLAIGNPLGLSQTVTHGIVSATGRGQLGLATFENFIQTDAAINEGNSGGALINTNGELIGINTAVIAKNAGSAGVEGIGFAIPVNLARGVMDEILKHGRVVRGWIGIVPEDIDNEQAQSIGLAQGGVVITNIYVGSPAQQAGLRPGDIVLTIDGKTMRNAQDALAHLATKQPGSHTELELLRGKEQIKVDVKVAEESSARAASAS